MASDCSWGKSRRPAVALRVIGVFDQYLAGIRSLADFNNCWTLSPAWKNMGKNLVKTQSA